MPHCAVLPVAPHELPEQYAPRKLHVTAFPAPGRGLNDGVGDWVGVIDGVAEKETVGDAENEAAHTASVVWVHAAARPSAVQLVQGVHALAPGAAA